MCDNLTEKCSNINEACILNHSKCLDKYLKKRKPKRLLRLFNEKINVDCLKIFEKHGYDINVYFGTYASCGLLEHMEYIISRGYELTLRDSINACLCDTIDSIALIKKNNGIISHELYISALSNRCMCIINYLDSINCIINIDVLKYAFKTGNYRYVEVIYQICAKQHIGLTTELYVYAINNKKSLLFLINHNVPFPTHDDFCRLCESIIDEPFSFIFPENLCEYVAGKSNNVEILKILVENGCSLTNRMCYIIANKKYGNVFMLKYVYDKLGSLGDISMFKCVYPRLQNVSRTDINKAYEQCSDFIISLNVFGINYSKNPTPWSKYNY